MFKGSWTCVGSGAHGRIQVRIRPFQLNYLLTDFSEPKVGFVGQNIIIYCIHILPLYRILIC